MNRWLQRRLKRPADTLEHLDQEGSSGLEACSRCGTRAGLHPLVTGNSGQGPFCHICGLQYELLGRGVNELFQEAPPRLSIAQEGPATKKRRTIPETTASDHATDKSVAVPPPANHTENLPFPELESKRSTGHLHEHDTSTSLRVPSAAGVAEEPFSKGLGENQPPRFPFCHSATREFVDRGNPHVFSTPNNLASGHGRAGALSTSQIFPSSTSEPIANASEEIELQASVDPAEMISGTTAEFGDCSCLVHLADQRGSYACSNMTIVDKGDISGDCRAATRYIPVEGGGSGAHVSDEDFSKTLQILLNSSRAVLPNSASRSCRPHNHLKLEELSFTWVAQLKDIMSGHRGFTLKWSASEQAIQTLAILYSEIRSPSYQLPSLLPGLHSDEFVRAFRGAFPAYGEARGAPVTALVHLNMNQGVKLEDEHQESNVGESSTAHANNPARRPPFSLVGVSTRTVSPLGASKQANMPRRSTDSITKTASERTVGTPRDGEITYIESSRLSTPVIEVMSPDPAAQPGSDEPSLLSLAHLRLRAIQGQHASLEQENTCLRHQVTTLREDLTTAEQAREDALRHGCETIEELHELVVQYEQRGVESKECILRLAKDVNRVKKSLRRDHVIFHLTFASARRKLKQANSRLEEARSHIPNPRELSDVGVNTHDLAQRVSTGVMHQSSVDVRTSNSYGVQAGEPVKHNTHHGPRGADHNRDVAFTITAPRAIETEELDARVCLKLAEAELSHLRAKLAYYEQTSVHPHNSSAEIPVDTSALAERHTVPGFTKCIARLEQEADRYLRRRRKRAIKVTSVATAHTP